MTITYGGWTLDHTICVVASCLVICLIHALRYTKNFALFALAYSLLLFGSIAASAVQESVGINSALLPMLICGSILNGFVCGWRMVSVYFVLSIAFIWGLYFVSASAGPADLVALTIYSDRIFQRAVQVSISLVLVSVFSAFITIAMNNLFARLETMIKKATQSEKEKMEFLANMSHELRTPLNGVSGVSQILNRSELSRDQRKYVTIIHRCGKRLNQIVSDSLELYKLDSGKFSLDQSEFNMRDLLEDVVRRYGNFAKDKGVRLGLSFPQYIPEVYVGDQKRFRRVMKNLISNGVKFTDSGSVQIDVHGRLKGANRVTLKIQVKDTGIGIPEDQTSFIFDRFKQLETGLNRKTEGTGLGLAICREFITFMGGNIRVDSQPGIGSCFEVNIDMRAADAAEQINTVPQDNDTLRAA